MKHPELIYLAAERLHISVMKVIYDAFDWKRIYISARTFSAVYDQFLRSGRIPEYVEDYALNLLAKNEREVKQQQWLGK